MSAPRQWKLDASAFDRLLGTLAADRETASHEYEALRERLTCYFDWHGAPFPETLADETLDRIARKLQEGEQIENIHRYARAVARHVFQESSRRRARERAAVAEIGRAAEPVAPPDDRDVRLLCVQRCLERLPVESRALLLAYYEGKGRIHLEERRGLAERLGLSYSGLKMRAHRARGLLEECVRDCVQGRGKGDR